MRQEAFVTAVADLPAFRKDRVRRSTYADEHHTAALRYAEIAYQNGDHEDAETWALRALHDGPSCAAFMLLADICEADYDLTNARRWLQAARGALATAPRRYEAFCTLAQIEARLNAVARLLREQWRLRTDLHVPLLETIPPDTYHNLATLLAAVPAQTAACWQPQNTPTIPAPRMHVPPEVAALIAVAPALHVPDAPAMAALRLPARVLRAVQQIWCVVLSPHLIARLRTLSAEQVARIDAAPKQLADYIGDAGWGLINAPTLAHE